MVLALAAAALLARLPEGRGLRGGVILSGGNVEVSQVHAWRAMR